MDCSHIRRVLILNVKEEARDRKLVQSAFCAWKEILVDQPQAEVGEATGCECEAYHPRWMSRKVLMQQVRRCDRTVPTGLKLRSRAGSFRDRRIDEVVNKDADAGEVCAAEDHATAVPRRRELTLEMEDVGLFCTGACLSVALFMFCLTALR